MSLFPKKVEYPFKVDHGYNSNEDIEVIKGYFMTLSRAYLSAILTYMWSANKLLFTSRL